MEIIYKEGNLLDSNTDVIAHQVNCQGVMGSGVAKQIKDKWPEVFSKYTEYIQQIGWDKPFYLKGKCQLVDRTGRNSGEWIANLFAQYNYGRDSKRYTNYEDLYISLESLKEEMEKKHLISVSFPYKMSSDRGGADWDVVLTMIKSVFKNTDITIEIWKYDTSRNL